MVKVKALIKDILDFLPRIFAQSWVSLKWDWEHRREKNNRFKRRRRSNELGHYWRERKLKAEGRV